MPFLVIEIFVLVQIGIFILVGENSYKHVTEILILSIVQRCTLLLNIIQVLSEMLVIPTYSV